MEIIAARPQAENRMLRSTTYAIGETCIANCWRTTIDRQDFRQEYQFFCSPGRVLNTGG